MPSAAEPPAPVRTATGPCIVLAGALITVAALWRPWAVDGPRRGFADDVNGWGWMAVGDVYLVLACTLVLGLTLLIPRLATPSRVHAAAATGAAALGLGLLGVALVRWLTGFDFIVMDESDLREHDPGSGWALAMLGLLVALAGVAVASFARLAALRTAQVPERDPT